MHSISHVCTLHLHVNHLPEGLFGIPLMNLDSDSTCPPQGVVGEKSIDIQPGSSGLPSTGAYAEAAVDAVSCGDVRWCCDANAVVLFVRLYTAN